MQQAMVVCIAGATAGAVLGVFLRTRTEIDGGRRGLKFWAPFDGSCTTGLLCNELLKFVFIVVLIAGIGALTLRLGLEHQLTKSDTQLLAVAWLTGVGIAKWARYRYWRNAA